MKFLSSIICLIFITSGLKSQNYDNQWLFGYFHSDTSNFGLTLLDFNQKNVTWNYKPNEKKYFLGFTGSFVNNLDGILQYSTNGCNIKNANDEVINTDGYITTTGTGYPGCESDVIQNYSAYQSNILLPDLLDPQTYYTVHNDFHFTLGPMRTENMNFSIIKNGSDSTLFYSKGKINSEDLTCLNLTAVPSHDLTAWWIVMPRLNSNIFESYKITKDSAYLVNTQEIGIELQCIDLGIGQVQFSNDASMLGINSEVHGVLLYDFDNETGTLSNFRSIPYPNSIELAQGLVFSMDNTKLYVNSAEYLYQIDLANNNEITLLAEVFEPDETGWPISLGMMFMGPDCRIYISPGSTTFYIHTIESPDKAGEACDFRKKRIKTPAHIAHHFPNIAQYRYINGCDSTIVLPEIVPIIEKSWQNDIVLFPNPATSQVTINSLPYKVQQLFIFNVMGELIKTLSTENRQEIIIDISDLSTGLYYITAVDKNGAAIISKRFVKQR